MFNSDIILYHLIWVFRFSLTLPSSTVAFGAAILVLTLSGSVAGSIALPVTGPVQ